MNAINTQVVHAISPINSAGEIEAAIAAACKTIAPTWPLDRFIAVNPYWGLIDRSFLQTHAELLQLSGSSLFMPREFYRYAFSQGHFSKQHLAQAINDVGANVAADELILQLGAIETPPARLPLLSDAVDARRDLRHEPAWSDTMTHQLSQFCAAYFDTAQSDWRPMSERGLYAAWRDGLIHDHSVAPLMHAPHIAQRAQLLPTSAHAMIAFALQHFCIDEINYEMFLRAILLRMNGWAAWCAYLRWQAHLAGAHDDHIVELLAMRLAWEYVLDDGAREQNSVWVQWQREWKHALHASVDVSDFAIYQRALEIGYQSALIGALATAPREKSTSEISAQAIFCIDVRSEVFRRALETVAPTISTHGFAGFFGLPISYTPIGTDATRPQLPGLLAPSLQVSDTTGNASHDSDIAQQRKNRLSVNAMRQPFQRLPGSAFTLVEALGLGYAVKLVRRSLRSAAKNKSSDAAGLSQRAAQMLRPRLCIAREAVQQRADLAEKIVRAMSLGSDLARLVLLVGHGSRSANNPHAAGLDCGACCGQTGEVNARALAAVLNEKDVRDALRERDIFIPAHTYFVAALHNTTTDEVQLFDTDVLPATHARDLMQLNNALCAAGVRARAERAPQLGLAHLQNNAEELAQTIFARANDWAQTRPEWGLANNAAFIVAPRARSQHINLHGRAFLHDYDWQRDHDNSVLELIMTAPMIVTHWINMQYHASTVDNQRYGSGNKILHNVVGGHIGVFEGNGGDLRIGLPLQSVHDGERWMHTPLRLSVFIEAPQAMIDAVIAKHAQVRQLLENDWLYVFRIDSQTHAVEAYRGGQWRRWDIAAAG